LAPNRAQRHTRSLCVPFVDSRCHSIASSPEPTSFSPVLWSDSSYGVENLHAVGDSEPD
jgi:hypothetical protein